jgi:hypothetical protein
MPDCLDKRLAVDERIKIMNLKEVKQDDEILRGFLKEAGVELTADTLCMIRAAYILGIRSGNNGCTAPNAIDCLTLIDKIDKLNK